MLPGRAPVVCFGTDFAQRRAEPCVTFGPHQAGKLANRTVRPEERGDQTVEDVLRAVGMRVQERQW